MFANKYEFCNKMSFRQCAHQVLQNILTLAGNKNKEQIKNTTSVQTLTMCTRCGTGTLFPVSLLSKINGSWVIATSIC